MCTVPAVSAGFLSLLCLVQRQQAPHTNLVRLQGTGVACAVIQRGGGKGNRVADATVASAFFSHHQKSVVCDAPPPVGDAAGFRSLVAFVGGLDLTLGAPPPLCCWPLKLWR